MPEIFVCTNSPMGGVQIVFVAATVKEARLWVEIRIAQRGGEYFIYQQVKA